MVTYLRRVLKLERSASVFLYVNSCFAPALDEVVGNLHRVSGVFCFEGWVERVFGRWLMLGQCFKDSKDQLIVSYSMTPAFG